MVQGSKQRGRLLIYVALILIVGLIAVYFILQGMAPKSGGASQGQGTPTAQVMDVVVLAVDVTRGTLLDASMLSTIPFPMNVSQTVKYYVNKEEIIGKRVRFDTAMNSPLTEAMLVDSSDRSFAASLIPPGMTAVSIPINRLSAVSYAPQPGDKVNVIVTLLLVDLDPAFQTILPNNTGGVIAPGQSGLVIGNRLGMEPGTSTLPLNNVVAQTVAGGQNAPVGRAEIDPALNQPFYLVPAEDQRPRMLSQTLIQNVTVLQVGNFPTVNTAAAKAQAAEGKPTPTPEPQKPPDVITLVVNPQDAVTLNYLLFNDAKITLALRGVNDDQDLPTQSVTLKFLMEQYNIAVPEKMGYGIEPKVESLSNPKLENETNPLPQ